jgi:homoserine O-acetyltransferase
MTACTTYPAPEEHDFVLKRFAFHTGDTLPELRIHYRTIGDPANPAALILHGTGGSGASMLTPGFADQLFGQGQPLDARKHYLILPDSIGAGQSAKPSDGLRTDFPRYTHADMVTAQYRLLTEGLTITHLRVVIGYSMGGMHTWLWAVTYPDFMDAAVPLASQPAAVAGRNWMMRRMLTDAVRNDPAWKGGNYTKQPEQFRLAYAWYTIATNGGTLALQAKAPTRAMADALTDRLLADRTAADANDFLYQWEASREYDPTPDLPKARARILAVNSADDERNPPETGLTEQAVARLPNAEYCLIPADARTAGHATVMNAALWKDRLETVLRKSG